MDNAPATPNRPSPPPPDLATTPPPPPSLVASSDTPPFPSQPHEVADKLNIRIARDVATDPASDGELAPFNTRFIAAVIDLVLAVGLQIAVWFVLPGFFGATIPALVGLAYLVTRDSLPFLDGQSVGKKAMHLKAVTLDDKSLAGNWEPGLIRNAVLVIPLFALVEVFVLLTREDKPEHGRRLGDEWAKTKVIVVKILPALQPPDNPLP